MADVTDTPQGSCTSGTSSESLVAWPFDFTDPKDPRKYLGHQPQPLTSWDHPCALHLALTLCHSGHVTLSPLTQFLRLKGPGGPSWLRFGGPPT